eukprot:262523_1
MSIQPTPIQFENNSIIYCTRYEQHNVMGIYKYNMQNEQHELIKSWNDMNYYPGWNVMIYSKLKNTIFFVGGANRNTNENYTKIVFYKIDNDTVTNIDVGFVIGSNPKIAITNNDRFFHIIGGRHNSKHILFNLETNETKNLYSFEKTQPNVTEQGLVYNQSRNMLIMFGGRTLQQDNNFSNAKYNSLWMYDLNKNAKMISCAFVKDNFLKKQSGKQYDVLINEVIAMYLGEDMLYAEWKLFDEYKLPEALYGFGFVMYDDRILIAFGGSGKFKSSDDILYLDLNGKDGWKQCECKLPSAGYCHALLIDNKTVHILPYYQNTMYYTIDIHDLLPINV